VILGRKNNRKVMTSKERNVGGYKTVRVSEEVRRYGKSGGKTSDKSYDEDFGYKSSGH